MKWKLYSTPLILKVPNIAIGWATLKNNLILLLLKLRWCMFTQSHTMKLIGTQVLWGLPKKPIVKGEESSHISTPPRTTEHPILHDVGLRHPIIPKPLSYHRLQEPTPSAATLHDISLGAVHSTLSLVRMLHQLEPSEGILLRETNNQL